MTRTLTPEAEKAMEGETPAAGHKIIEGIREAIRGDFARVTVAGQTWVRLDRVDTIEGCIREIVRAELIRYGVVKDCSGD